MMGNYPADIQRKARINWRSEEGRSILNFVHEEICKAKRRGKSIASVLAECAMKLRIKKGNLMWAYYRYRRELQQSWPRRPNEPMPRVVSVESGPKIIKVDEDTLFVVYGDAKTYIARRV
jgi:hypothetical protein